MHYACRVSAIRVDRAKYFTPSIIGIVMGNSAYGLASSQTIGVVDTAYILDFILSYTKDFVNVFLFLPETLLNSHKSLYIHLFIFTASACPLFCFYILIRFPKGVLTQKK